MESEYDEGEAVKIATRRVYVVECPTCRKPIDWSGEGGVYFESRADLEVCVGEYRSCEPSMSLTEFCGCKRRKEREAQKARKG